jgi:predicted transcriptional regulator
MSDLPPTARVMQVLIGAMNSAAVSAIARLGIPDHLESGPKTIEELAHAVDAKPELLFRLMRATAGLGVLTETPDVSGRKRRCQMSYARMLPRHCGILRA